MLFFLSQRRTRSCSGVAADEPTVSKAPTGGFHLDGFPIPWILPRAKKCPPDTFCTSVRTGAALSNPNPRPIKNTTRCVVRMRDSIKLRCCRRRDRRQATVHRTVAFRSVRIPHDHSKKSRYPDGYLDFLAEDEGFEPPRTESESGVLPLH